MVGFTIKGEKMTYAVVLNPPSKRKSPAQVAFRNKMRQLGKLYQQVKSTGNVPKWQDFVRRTVSGARFNSPVSLIGSAGVSGLTTFGLLHLIEKRTRIKAFSDYLTATYDSGEESKQAIEKYYGKQIAVDAVGGAVLTAAQFGIAKLSQKTSIGKYVSPWGVVGGGVAATIVKVMQRWSDLDKCKDYSIIEVIEKEANKYAKNNTAYFGDKWKSSIEVVLAANGKYTQTQEQDTGTQQIADDTNDDANTTQGITYDNWHVAGPVQYWG